jgi:hypothetical protein
MPYNPKSKENLIPVKKGEVRNPNGNYNRTKHISTWIQELGNDEDFEVYLQHPTKGYQSFKGAPVKAVVETAWRKAAAGDKDAREWVAKYGWKPQLDITSNDEKIEGLVIIKNNDNKPLGMADEST